MEKEPLTQVWLKHYTRNPNELDDTGVMESLQVLKEFDLFSSSHRDARTYFQMFERVKNVLKENSDYACEKEANELVQSITGSIHQQFEKLSYPQLIAGLKETSLLTSTEVLFPNTVLHNHYGWFGQTLKRVEEELQIVDPLFNGFDVRLAFSQVQYSKVLFDNDPEAAFKRNFTQELERLGKIVLVGEFESINTLTHQLFNSWSLFAFGRRLSGTYKRSLLEIASSDKVFQEGPRSVVLAPMLEGLIAFEEEISMMLYYGPAEVKALEKTCPILIEDPANNDTLEVAAKLWLSASPQEQYFDLSKALNAAYAL